MFGIIDFYTFLIGTIIIVLLPGPNSMYVATVAGRRGFLPAFQGAAGIFTGDLILMTLSVGGVASIVQTTPIVFTILKYAGGAYLMWLGVGLVRSLWQKRVEATEIEVPKDSKHPYRIALTISLLNPKAILFFISFFIQFVDPAYETPLLSFAILGVVVQICSQIYLAALIITTIYFKGLFAEGGKLARITKALAGSLFIGYGLKLALSNN
jgi:leucine efflux protein